MAEHLWPTAFPADIDGLTHPLTCHEDAEYTHFSHIGANGGKWRAERKSEAWRSCNLVLLWTSPLIGNRITPSLLPLFPVSKRGQQQAGLGLPREPESLVADRTEKPVAEMPPITCQGFCSFRPLLPQFQGATWQS
ncbi:uncharacterized protein LOC144577438 isoform X2 [Callithrix jacchus]